MHVITGPIEFAPVQDRWYRLAHGVALTVESDTLGTILYTFRRGFLFDGRSGGPLGDLVAPNLGTPLEVACWLIHDANGYGGALSFRETNALLRQMLRLSGYGPARAWLVWAAVSLSRSWFGRPQQDDRELQNVHPRPMFSIRKV